MIKTFAAALVGLCLTGCGGMAVMTVGFVTSSDCSGGRESTYTCQVDRYSRAGQ